MTTETLPRSMTVDETRRTMARYLESGHSDLEIMAPDVCFTVMATGQEFRGPDAIAAMLGYFYTQAFQAQAINERFGVLGGVDLPDLPREAIRPPVDFGE